ncbi:MAG: sigma-70 family RNA polymerase sigma factor, partial [Deltaproteobacteria bacterium]|nr:sigma-70 family RNA polymerase sigma factor [Nannocystaceae bacterium]
MATDDQLWARACSGDDRAWLELCRSLHARVHRFFTHKVVDHDVADLAQQTIQRFMEARARFEGRSGVRGYVFGIAYNLLCEYIRRRTIRGSAADPDEVSAADLAPRPSSVLRMREDGRRLLEALRLLPIAAQTLIELFYFEELTTAQIAESLGIPDNTVRGRLSRARARLRELVEAGGRREPGGGHGAGGHG